MINSNLIKDVILGIAIGDAFGSGLEAQDRRFLEKTVDFSKYLSFRAGKYAQGYRLGDYSDDTSDTLAVINALSSEEPFSADTLLKHIHALWEDSKKSRNGLPRAGFGSLQKVFEGKTTIEELRAWQAQRAYPGNAPPMRAIPFGFLPENLINYYCTINADISHPHPKARAASILVARAARYLLVIGDPQTYLIPYCRAFVKDVDAETYKYLDLVNKLPSELSEDDFTTLVGPQPCSSFMNNEQPITGLNCDAMRTAGTALYILKHSKTSFEALKRSILVGGDVDSLAAITVGISSGLFGLNSLPGFLLEGLEGSADLTIKAEQFSKFLNKL